VEGRKGKESRQLYVSLHPCVFSVQVILEASVGNTGMSDIAVDDVVFVQGPCPGTLIVRYTNSSVQFKQ
jgi:hypothetical protein